MQLPIFMAVLMTVVISEQLPRVVVGDAALHCRYVALVVALVSSAIILSGRAVVLYLRRLPTAERRLSSWPARVRSVFVAVWLYSSFLVLYVLQWPVVVRFNFGLSRWWLIDELLIFFPLLPPLLLAWMVFREINREQQASVSEQPETNSVVRVLRHLGSCLLHELSLPLLPWLLLSLFGDMVGHLPVTATWGAAPLYAPVLVAVVTLFPWFLTHLWRTEPLVREPLRSQLAAVAEETHLRVRNILIWHTGGRMLNAVLVGLTGRSRYVFLTDGLLTRLSTDEVAAVFRHEVAHVRRWHLPVRMLVVIWPLCVWFSCLVVHPDWYSRVANLLPVLGEPWQSFLGPGLLVFYMVTALHYVAHLQEHDADLWSCGLYGGLAASSEQVSRVGVFCRALQRIVPRCVADYEQAGWLHPSVAERVRLLQHSAANVAAAHRVRRSVRGLHWLIAAGYGGIALLLTA